MLSYLLTLLDDEAGKAQFRSFYEQYYPVIARAARHYAINKSDTEDAIQNTFLKIIRHFEKISSFPCPEIEKYIVTIVKNECYSLHRARVDAEPLEDWAPVCASETRGYAALIACIRQLPDAYRSALEMKFVLGYSTAEIARMLGIGEEAAKKRITRARAQLLKILEEKGIAL